MTDDVTSRVLRLFERRLKNDPEVSETTVGVLLEGQRTRDFGDDDELLEALLDESEEDAWTFD